MHLEPSGMVEEVLLWWRQWGSIGRVRDGRGEKLRLSLSVSVLLLLLLLLLLLPTHQSREGFVLIKA